MTEERPTPPGLELSPEDLAALPQRYTAQDVVAFFQTLGLPVSDDSSAITEVIAREKPQREQDSLSPDPALQQQAAHWLTAARLIEYQPSRRELLLLVQEAVNRMFSFRLERYGQASKPYTPELRADLKAGAMRGFVLSDDLAERFLRAFEHGSGLRFSYRVPLVLRSFNIRDVAEETFNARLTALIIPELPPEASSGAGGRVSQSTEPMRAIRPKRSAAKASSPPAAPARRPSGPILTPGNAITRLSFTQEGQPVEVLLSKDTISIGRMPDSDVFLKDDLRVSRQHAVIHRAPTAFILTDLGSANGTYLNGALLTEPTVLHSGDHIRIGHTELTFIMEPLVNHHE